MLVEKNNAITKKFFDDYYIKKTIPINVGQKNECFLSLGTHTWTDFLRSV